MPKFRCDFQVDSELALPSEQPELRAIVKSGHEIFFRNGAQDTAGNIPFLICSVVGDSNDLLDSKEEFRSVLANYLDLLSFSTQSRFKIEKPLRLLDWEPGSKDRRMKVFEAFEDSYPPRRILTDDFLQTARAVEKAGIPDFAGVALKYFRYGLLDEAPEDQFMHFWLALEITAENIKPTDELHVTCTDCGSPMKCSNCGAEPHRRPMGKDAINEIVRLVAKDRATDVSKRLWIARNGIMHGGSVASIESKCSVQFEEIVNESAFVAWNAIAVSIPRPDTSQVTLLQRKDFTRKVLTVSIDVDFSHTGTTEHPGESEIPDISIGLSDHDHRD